MLDRILWYMVYSIAIALTVACVAFIAVLIGAAIISLVTPAEHKWTTKTLPNGVTCYFESAWREYPTWCDDGRAR